MQKDETKKPVMATIPETGQSIDVRPLIDFLQDKTLASIEDSTKVMAERIDGHIENIAKFFTFDIERVADPKTPEHIYDTLFAVRNMFYDFKFLK